MACGALGYNDAGLVFLGAGVFSWLSLEPVILQRLRSCGELPAVLRTSLGIQLAPALVACSAAERQWRGGRHAGENAIRLRSVTAFIYAAINAPVFITTI